MVKCDLAVTERVSGRLCSRTALTLSSTFFFFDPPAPWAVFFLFAILDDMNEKDRVDSDCRVRSEGIFRVCLIGVLWRYKRGSLTFCRCIRGVRSYHGATEQDGVQDICHPSRVVTVVQPYSYFRSSLRFSTPPGLSCKSRSTATAPMPASLPP